MILLVILVLIVVFFAIFGVDPFELLDRSFPKAGKFSEVIIKIIIILIIIIVSSLLIYAAYKAFV